MKLIIFSLLLFLGLPFVDYAKATEPEYFSSRDSIKDKSHSITPSQDVIYLGVITNQAGFESGLLVQYRKTLKIQDLLAMTSYKGRLAGITVLRAKNPVEPVFNSICKPGSKIDFVLQPGDVVWAVEPYAPET